MGVGCQWGGWDDVESWDHSRKISLKDGTYYCYCAYVLRISRYSGFLWVVPTKGRTIRKVMGGGGGKPKKKFMQGKMPRKKIRAKKKGKKKFSCRRKVQL